MKNQNGYGSVFKLSGKRRRHFCVRVTTGWTGNHENRKETVYTGRNRSALGKYRRTSCRQHSDHDRRYKDKSRKRTWYTDPRKNYAANRQIKELFCNQSDE